MKKLLFALMLLISFDGFCQKGLEIYTGIGVLDFSPQNISYINYLPQREPYKVIPPRQHLVFFPASLGLKKDIFKITDKLDLGLAFTVNMAALVTTTGGGNYFALQMPTSLDLKYNFSEKFNFFVGGGMAFSRMAGDDLIERSDFLPIVETGIQFYIGNKKLELCYNRTFISGMLDFEEPLPWGNYFGIENIDVQTQSLIIRYNLVGRKKVNDVLE